MAAVKNVFNILGTFKAEGTFDPQLLSRYLEDSNVPKYVREAVEDMKDQVFTSEKHFVDELGHILDSAEKANKFKHKALKALVFKSDASTIIVDDDHIIPRTMMRFFGKHLELSISVFRPKRTLAQNRYLHGVVVPTVIGWAYENTGIEYSIDEIKQFIYEHVLKQRNVLKQVLGVEVSVHTFKRFSEMTTVEFNDAVEFLQGYFAPKGCHIPNPTQNSFIADYVKKKKGRRRR